MREIDAVELKAYLEASEESPLLLDVRQPWEFDTCHIAGSELIPMNQIQARIQELDPEKETVVICHHGIRSRSVATFLEQMGFNKVINLNGGVDSWAKTVDKEMATY